MEEKEEGVRYLHKPNTASNSRKTDYLVFKTSWLLDRIHLSEEAFALLVFILASSRRQLRYNFEYFRHVRYLPNIPRTVVPNEVFKQCLSAALKELLEKKVVYRIVIRGTKSDPKNVYKRLYIDQKVAFISNEDWFMQEGYMWIEKAKVVEAMKPLLLRGYGLPVTGYGKNSETKAPRGQNVAQGGGDYKVGEGLICLCPSPQRAEM